MKRVVNDLVEHVLTRHFAAIERATDLLETDDEKFAFIITMMGSELASFVATLAHANPVLANLPERMRFVAANFLLYRALGLKLDAFPSTQEMSDLFVAIQSYPEVSLK